MRLTVVAPYSQTTSTRTQWRGEREGGRERGRERGRVPSEEEPASSIYRAGTARVDH